MLLQRGVWRYKVENRADSHQALHIQVASLPSSSNDVQVRVWTNQDSQTVIDVEDHRAIIIYGEVKVRNPVTDLLLYRCDINQALLSICNISVLTLV